MKLLTLIRHAKSSWADPYLHDSERPLNKRGQRDLPLMARRVAESLPQTELILTSSAKRCTKTATAISLCQMETPVIETIPELYESCYETLLNVIQNQSNQYHHLLLVGHNPGLAALIHYLTHSRIKKLPTAAVAHLQLNILEWPEVAESCARLDWLDTPKQHAPYQ